MSRRKSYSGKFQPKNPQKYKGDLHNIVFRSLWERGFMSFLDMHKSVTAWGSETCVIPYTYSIDMKQHRYFVDFFVEVIEKTGKKQKYLIEIKPYAETQPPIQRKKKSNRYLEEVCTYVKNQEKWKAAQEYCSKNGLKFQILTERDLFGKLGLPKTR
jgi:hypothetical protein